MTPREFEDTRYFEGCLPIEVMIERGPGTLAHGPMKPVGLADPSTGLRPFAVVQLRKENLEGTCYNLVGFQTRLKWPDQDRVFRLIPALADAEFLRYGSIHRNTFLRSPGLLDLLGSTIERPGLFFAGQITGVEGYIESTASGLLSGLYAAAMLRGIDIDPAPRASAHGSLMHYISASDPDRFQPSNIHMGLLPAPAEGTPKKQRKRVQSERALAEFARWRDVWVKALRGI